MVLLIWTISLHCNRTKLIIHMFRKKLSIECFKHLTESYLPCTPLSKKFIWNDDYDNISRGAFIIHASEVNPVENKSWHICFPVQLATLAALQILILQDKLQKNMWKEDCPQLQGCRNAKSLCNGTIIQRRNIFNNKHAAVIWYLFSWGYKASHKPQISAHVLLNVTRPHRDKWLIPDGWEDQRS